MLAWNSMDQPSKALNSLLVLIACGFEFLGTSQDHNQIVLRQVKFNTIITQNNLQSQQQSQASANTKEQWNTFLDSDMEIFRYLSFHYTQK